MLLIDAEPTVRPAVVPMERWHYCQAWDLALGRAHPGNPETMARELLATGRARALVHGPTVFCCAGVAVPAWPGVGLAWALVTPAGRAYPVTVHRAVRRELAQMVAELALRRLEATVYGEDLRLHRWVRALGFQPEGARPLAGPAAETAYVYARTWEERA